jgi:amino acid adenylation domain-containing protein
LLSTPSIRELKKMTKVQASGFRGITDTQTESECVHELFEIRANAVPDSVALVHGDEFLTYGAVNRRSNYIARTLRDRGVGPEVLVGICGTRSKELFVGELAILKAGAGYVPIDPSSPAGRINRIISDAGISLIVTVGQGNRVAWPDTVTCISVDERIEVSKEAANSLSAVKPDNVAVVIYTSGSTGMPKGVVLTHRAIVARILNSRNHYGNAEVVCHKTPIGVVAYVIGFFAPLSLGFTVIILDDESVRSVREFATTVRSMGITRIGCVPSQLRVLLEDSQCVKALSELNAVSVVGEPTSPELLSSFRKRLPAVRLFNAYGLTETAGAVSSGLIGNEISIGKATSSKTIVIIDKAGKPVTAGAVGFVCVRGPQLARGYLHSPRTTAERFIADSFSTGGERMLITGDIGEYLEDGTIKLIGRSNTAVENGGYDVSLADLERCLEKEQNVDRAVVVWDSVNTMRLKVFVVPAVFEERTDMPRLQRIILEKVSEYAVSVHIVRHFPLLFNGKVDRQKLSAGDFLPAQIEG